MNHRTHRNRNDRAEVGIGTLIVFIAMVLVAAIAAAVLVNTSGLLQSRALSAGKATSDEVASNLKIIEVYGNRSLTTGSLTNVTVYLQLAAGGLPINMDKIWIHWADADGVAEITKGGSPSSTKYTSTFVRNEGAQDVLLQPGEMVKVHWSVTLAEREAATVSINPDIGAQAIASFTAPSSFGSLKNIQLV